MDDEVQIPWVVGTTGPSHSISGYAGGGPVSESYGIPAAQLRAAGWVPASEAERRIEDARAQRDTSVPQCYPELYSDGLLYNASEAHLDTK